MRRPFWLVLGVVALSLSHLSAQGLPPKSKLLQEEGAVYLEGLVKKQIKGRLTEPAPCYSNLNGGRWLGNLLPNQEVVLLAVSEKAFRVRGRAQQGNVAGWVRKDQVAGISQEMLDSLGTPDEDKSLHLFNNAGHSPMDADIGKFVDLIIDFVEKYK